MLRHRLRKYFDSGRARIAGMIPELGTGYIRPTLFSQYRTTSLMDRAFATGETQSVLGPCENMTSVSSQSVLPCGSAQRAKRCTVHCCVGKPGIYRRSAEKIYEGWNHLSVVVSVRSHVLHNLWRVIPTQTLGRRWGELLTRVEGIVLGRAGVLWPVLFRPVLHSRAQYETD